MNVDKNMSKQKVDAIYRANNAANNTMLRYGKKTVKKSTKKKT